MTRSSLWLWWLWWLLWSSWVVLVDLPPLSTTSFLHLISLLSPQTQLSPFYLSQHTMDGKKNETSTEPVWPPAGMLQCPKNDCPRLFTSRAAMESHQMSYKDLALCLACNIQFATHEELFLHRLVSKRHHTCPICNRGFKSEDGRDFHIQTVSFARTPSPETGRKISYRFQTEVS